MHTGFRKMIPSVVALIIVTTITMYGCGDAAEMPPDELQTDQAVYQAAAYLSAPQAARDSEQTTSADEWYVLRQTYE